MKKKNKQTNIAIAGWFATKSCTTRAWRSLLSQTNITNIFAHLMIRSPFCASCTHIVSSFVCFIVYLYS